MIRVRLEHGSAEYPSYVLALAAAQREIDRLVAGQARVPESTPYRTPANCHHEVVRGGDGRCVVCGIVPG